MAMAVGCAAPATSTEPARIAVSGDSALPKIFTRVGEELGVPSDLLAAVSWNETRFHFAEPGGADSHAFEVGLMALTDGGPRDLARASRLAGVTEEAVRTDPEASIRAGAALLRDYALAAPSAAPGGDFTHALVAYGGDGFARAIQQALARGVDGRDDAGNRVVIAARRAPRPPGFGTVTQAAGYPGAEWVPAYSGNYQTANRGVGDIKYIIVHDTEGSYAGTLSWFKNSSANVSAHYVLRSSDGHIAQMVDEKDIAWHVGCFNTKSVGLEHEGYASKPDVWFTEAMYIASAELTAYLADKYSIPKEHGTHAIMGHGEAPDCSSHTDPGTGWKWEHYIDLVRTGGAPQFKGEELTVEAPEAIVSGELATVTVRISNTGTAAWDLDATRVGTQEPQDRDSAFFVEGDWLAPNRATAVDARTDPNTQGTFTFQIRAPEVSEPTVYDEAFALVQEGVTWFGPTFHVVVQVQPRADEPTPPAGCHVGGAGSGGIACAMLALGALRRRRRR